MSTQSGYGLEFASVPQARTRCLKDKQTDRPSDNEYCNRSFFKSTTVTLASIHRVRLVVTRPGTATWKGEIERPATSGNIGVKPDDYRD